MSGWGDKAGGNNKASVGTPLLYIGLILKIGQKYHFFKKKLVIGPNNRVPTGNQ
jgi:hypothetical protein